MKKQLLLFIFLLAVAFKGYSQTGRPVTGIVADSSGVTIPGVVVKLTSPTDSINAVTDINGVFKFGTVKSQQFSLTILSIGFEGLKRNYKFDADNKPANLGTIKLKTESKLLNVVQITDVNAVKIKEDTTEYKASAYPVRANASTEEVLKKLPGVDVDANGNITAEGKQVTKVRINGKDFFGGDVQTATKNLPADVIESIQMIDDYGDQANITGIKSGDPTKVMNIVIRKDKNYGYSLSGTAGVGRDAVPAPATNSTRYTFSTNSFEFNGDQQIALLGGINNNNTNTFNFGGGGGGGGGRGNASRSGGGGAAAASTTASTANGITDAKSVGFNFRDQWGKTLSVYGSYSFADNSTNILSTTLQKNYQTVTDATNATQAVTRNNNQSSNETDGVLNHRVTWNMEWKPDTINYLKFTPTYSYGSTTTNAFDLNDFSLITNGVQAPSYLSYNTTTTGSTNTHSIGANVLYNHKFNSHGRNFSINATGSSSPNFSYSNPISVYFAGKPNSPQNQFVFIDSHTNSVNTSLSYIEPLSKVSFLEGTYTYSYAHTTNDKTVDTVQYASTNIPLTPAAISNYGDLSNTFNYNFITNRFALNYRLIKSKYNFTIGLGIQPSELKGFSPATATQASVTTDVKTTNFSPTLRYVYNFSRSQAFTLNYNGSSSQPTYTQLNPRLDVSNASYPVQGNPNLQPEFTNTVSFRYNQFSFGTGDLMFSNLSFSQVNDHIVQNITTYPRIYKPNTKLNNSILTTYTNVDGYYTGNGFFTYAKPWDKRKYTLIFNANVSYANNISYLSNVSANADSSTYTTTTNKNLAKTLTFTPGIRFRVDITDVIDAQANASYGITKTNNSLPTAPYSDYRTTLLGVAGKNYFWTNWTLSYDYSKTIYNGFAGEIKNPNILTTYVERRFLKNNAATIRATVYDLFNENTGYTNTTTATQTTSANVNRLGRYYLLSFTFRLQKFAGKAPSQDMGPDGGRRRGGDGGGRGPGGGGGGFGGPGGGGPQ